MSQADLANAQYIARINVAIANRDYAGALDLLIRRNEMLWLARGAPVTAGSADFAAWERLRQGFTRAFLDSRLPHAPQEGGAGLIFIVGMPRSGKTTLELLLSGIPDVAAAGELNYLHGRFRKMQDPDGREWTYPDYIPALPPQAFAALGKDYEEAVRAQFPGKRFIIDTMPPTFRYLGFMRLILPQARVIHMVRDPLDHCIDIFSKRFDNDFYNYTYQLDSLAQMYVEYRRLMAHWDAVLGDWVLTLRFEDLVQHPKKELKKAVAFCGMEAQGHLNAAIRPHQDMLNEIGRTFGVLKNYRPHLTEFEKALGPYKKL